MEDIAVIINTNNSLPLTFDMFVTARNSVNPGKQKFNISLLDF